MRIGIAYDLRSAPVPGLPDDVFEEYDSEETVKAIEAVLCKAGYKTVRLGGGRDFLEAVLSTRVDMVFNIAEGWGTRSREAHVPSVLEILGIPYTGSDPLTLALTLDKGMAKRVIMSIGVSTPRFRIIKERSDIDHTGLSFPLILKLAWEGSSMGVRRNSKVETHEELRKRALWLLETYREPVLVEEFICGREVTVGVMGNEDPQVVGMMMIESRLGAAEEFIYSLEVKRNWREEVEYLSPPPLTGDVLNELRVSALSAYRVLGCRDVARLDFRLKDGKPYFLEANPLPGLNPETGDLPIMLGKVGISHEELVLGILECSLERTHLTENRSSFQRPYLIRKKTVQIS